RARRFGERAEGDRPRVRENRPRDPGELNAPCRPEHRRRPGGVPTRRPVLRYLDGPCPGGRTPGDGLGGTSRGTRESFGTGYFESYSLIIRHPIASHACEKFPNARGLVAKVGR